MQTKSIQKNNTESVVATLIVVWGVGAYFLGYTKVFTKIPQQAFGIIVASLLIGLIIFYFSNRKFRTFSDSIPLKTIALLHVWRIFAGWAFILYSDVLPQAFVTNAAYGVIVSGFLGLSVFIFRHTRLSYYVFNIIGSFDFIMAVGTGLYFAINGSREMEPIVLLPLIIIPLFGVPISGFTHFISLRRLIKMKGIKLTEPVID